jgi:hypothetical protein
MLTTGSPYAYPCDRLPHADTRWERNHVRLSAEMMSTTRAETAETSTRIWSPLLSSISMVAEPRGTVRRRVGLTSPPASGARGSSGLRGLLWDASHGSLLIPNVVRFGPRP